MGLLLQQYEAEVEVGVKGGASELRDFLLLFSKLTADVFIAPLDGLMTLSLLRTRFRLPSTG